MRKKNIWQVAALSMIVALLLTTIPALVGAQGKVLTSNAIHGELNTQFAKHYLALRPIDPNSPLEVVVNFAPADVQGFGFYIFDEGGFNQVVNGARMDRVNLSAGNPTGISGELNSVIGKPVGNFTIVVYNDSTTPVSYDLHVKNGLVRDDSDQVTDLNAPAEVTEAAPAATKEAAPAAAATAEATPEATETPTPAPAAVQPVVVRSSKLTGDLPEQFAQHFLGLLPLDPSKPVVVNMTWDPQDQQALDQSLNFFVLDENGLNKVVNGRGRPETSNIAAGNPVKNAPVKTRRAEVVNPTGTYTVIVSNGSTVPATYTLTVENAVLVDDAGQTNESKAVQPAEAAAPAAGAGTTTPATTAAALPETKVGETYVVKRGDLLGAIAKAAYGDVKYYKELCAYNNIPDCNRIEVGDEIILPPLEELVSGATAPATTATPEATPAPEETATPEATTEATPEAAAEATPEATTEATAEVTPEAAAEATPEATPEATSETTAAPAVEETPTAEAEAAGPADIVSVAKADGRFEILRAALNLAGLTDTLMGEGPFTLFAPTDAAFALLPEATLDSLLNDPTAMAEVLKYHVIAGKVMSYDLSGTLSAETLQGGMLTINVNEDDTITVNDVQVLETDLEASNGVIHVIDAVLIPPTEQ